MKDVLKLGIAVVALISLVSAIYWSTVGEWSRATYFMVLAFGLTYMGDRR